MSENSVFFENFSRNTRKFLKIPEILVFFDKINPYKENRISDVDYRVLEKQWVVHYRSFVPWLVDVHVNGAIVAFVSWVFSFTPLNYLYVAGFGLAYWFGLELLTEIIKPFKDGAKEIVRELPRK